jgi:GT2 family glycosyltransferase
VRYDAPPRASVLIVSFGNLELTRLCLASIQRAAGETPFEIIIVDNPTADNLAALELRKWERNGLLPLRLIENRENVGFAAANNQAAAAAKGDVLILLNNDTVVVPGWLDRLVLHLDARSALGLVGPVTNACGNEAAMRVPYADLQTMAQFAATYTAEHHGELVDIPMLTLFCAAIPKALYQTLGGLDERYGLGMFEDDDLTLAVQQAGREVKLARDVFVHHYGGAAFSALPQRDYLRIWWENRRAFEKKWQRKWQAR